MALPLPKVVADVGPGGPLVTAMGGINSLHNDMLLRKINAIKAQYAPVTAQAEAASKLAYANLMGPQFLAKILGNDAAVGNLGSDAAKNILSKITSAGLGSGSNSLNQMSGEQGSNNSFSGIGQPSTNNFSNHIVNAFKSLIGMGQNPNNQLNNTMKGIAHVESGGAQNPYTAIGRDTGNGDHALGKYQVLSSNVPEWTKEALGSSMTPQEFLNSPDAQEKVAAYKMNKELNSGRTPQDVGSIWLTGKPLAQAGNVHDANGTTASQYVNKMNEGMNQPEKTYAEKAGEYKGNIRQGEEAGKYRAAALKDIGESQLGLSHSGAVLNQMTNIIKDPVFQEMRDKIPFFQDKQLNWLEKTGTPVEKKLIGKFRSAAESFIASTVQGFSGKPLVREFDLAQRQKISPSDPIHVAEGKLQSAIALHDIAEKKNDIIAGLLKQGVDEADAVKQANKMVDVSAIERRTEELLADRITDEDIEHTAKATGMTKEQVIKRLKDEGRYHG